MSEALIELAAHELAAIDPHRPDVLTAMGARKPAGTVVPKEPGQPAAPALTSRLLTTSQLIQLPPPEYLIEGILPKASLSWLYGAPGSAKSFLAVDIAGSLATGQAWHGHDVIATKVLYIAAESPAGLGRRIHAWALHHGVEPDELDQHLYWHPGALNLHDYGAIAALEETVVELNIGLVIADTLARCTVGADENSAKDMGQVIHNASRLIAAGAAVLPLHHTGKDESRGGRGSSALKGAVDAELELSKLADGTRVLTNPKQKDAEEADRLTFSLTPVGDSAVLTRNAGIPAAFRPTTLMERVSAYLALTPDQPHSKRDVRSEVTGNNGYIDKALDRLELEGHVVREAKGYRLVRAYTAATDDPAAALLDQARDR